MHRRAATALLLGYAACSAAVTAFQLAPGLAAGQLLLALAVPLLLGFMLLSMPRSRTRGWVATALAFSWLGDTLGFSVLLKIAFFLGAQLAYCAAFWPYRARSLLGRPGPLLGFGTAVVGLTTVIAAHAGWLAPAVALYAGCLAAMVVLATGVHRLSTAGAGLFFASDVLLGYDFFLQSSEPTWVGVAVMATYLPAQALLVLGVRERVLAEASAGTGTEVAAPH